MTDEFSTEYDAIVLGTGMGECIVAAALSRIGQKVLHMDRNDYYSGDWACFNLEALQRWISKLRDGLNTDKIELPENSDPKSLLEEGESLMELIIESTSISNVTEESFIRAERPKTPEPSSTSDEKVSQGDTKEDPGGATKTEEKQQTTQESTDVGQSNTETLEPEVEENAPKKKKEWTMEELKSQYRRFNIDLIPKVLYCRGAMVELLISSDISKYCEFKPVTRVLTHINGKLEQVPCSRSDVFSSKQVSMIEKRMMMKFLTFAMDFEKHPEDYEGKESMLFSDYLKSQRLTANVQHYIRESIAMATDTTTTIEGLSSTQKFLRSLGRFGNTAFLWPVYGAGELPQCFCRVCAVFGGIYCLRRTAQSMIVDDKGCCTGIVDTEGKRIKTKYLIMDASYAGQKLLQSTGQEKTLSRAILITDRSILGDNEENISLLNLPTEDGRNVTVYELGSRSYACPEGLYVVHLTSEGSTKGTQANFAAIVDKLFQPAPSEGASEEGDERPAILWSLYFSVQDSSEMKLKPDSPDNVHLVAGPDAALDFDRAISQAREIFEKICPGEEFLPKAPNPEDIIWDDEEGSTSADAGSQEGASKETDGTTENQEGTEQREQTTTEPEQGQGDTDSKTVQGQGDTESKTEQGQGDTGSKTEQGQGDNDSKTKQEESGQKETTQGDKSSLEQTERTDEMKKTES